MSWTKVNIQGTVPAVYAHTSTFISTGKLFIYGGSTGSKITNDCFIFYMDTMSSMRPITTGLQPKCRAGHTCTLVGTKLLVWGGGDGENYLNDLFILDTETMAWSLGYTAGTSPSSRSRHSATLINDNQLLIMGGGGDTYVTNDAYILYTDQMIWQRLTINGAPLARWGHTATLVDDTVIVFGGHDGKQMLNDLSILDLKNMNWIRPKCSGDIPPPMAGHTSNLLRMNNKNFLVVFGGGDGNELYNDIYILDIQSYLWFIPILKGTNFPLKRCAHTATLFKDKTLLIFGGGDGERRFNDIFLFDLQFISLTPPDSYPITTANKKPQVARPRLQLPTMMIGGGGKVAAGPMIMKNPNRPNNNNINNNISNNINNNISSVNPVNITTWLNDIGMGAYAEQFIKEDMDLDVLPYLTEQHIIETLNITTLGARIRILQHLKNLPAPSQNPPPQQPPSQSSSAAAYGSVYISEEQQQLKRELDRRNVEIKRLEGIVQHLVSFQFVVPPPPPPPPNNKYIGRRSRNSGRNGNSNQSKQHQQQHQQHQLQHQTQHQQQYQQHQQYQTQHQQQHQSQHQQQHQTQHQSHHQRMSENESSQPGKKILSKSGNYPPPEPKPSDI